MNIVDIVILGLIALYFVSGAYRGFLPSLLNLGAFLVSWIASSLFSPLLARKLIGSPFFSSFKFYLEGAEKVTDYELVRRTVSSLSNAEMDSIIDSAALPSPYSRTILDNMKGQVFAKDGLTTVGEYFDMTIYCVIMNIIAFILVFLLLRLVLTLFTNAYSYSVDLPQLKKFDRLLGGAVALIRAFFSMHMLFSVVAIMIMIVPSQITDILNTSFFARVFYSGSVVLPFIAGKV